MKNFFYSFIILILSGLAVLTCTPAEQEFNFSTSVRLRFSQDTVLFDTLFTSVGSTTRRFLVYNDDPGAVRISSIRTIDTDSPFTLTVNGISGTDFQDIRLLGKDSMLVLVEAFIDPMDQDLPFIVEDRIQFQTNTNIQNIDLIAWGQDANFLSDSVLSCPSIWTSERPYVIFNSILVDSLCNLDIQPGVRIYSHTGSSIFVRGTINILGTPEERVLLANDRLDEGFVNAPGQWEGIFFLEGSTGNNIRFADIRNANYGIWLGTPDPDTIPDLHLEGVRIENMTQSGIVAFTSDLEAVNTVVSNCGGFCVGNFAGGNYKYVHCTFANFSSVFFREDPVFAVTDNLILADESILIGSIGLEMINTIVWGDFTEEILLNNEGGAGFDIMFLSNVVKTEQTLLDSGGNLLNTDPMFVDGREFDLRLDSLSPAINNGVMTGVIYDHDGKLRDSLPDIGAFEWQSGNNQ